jgi:molybdopterin molybdotransferase
MIPFEEARARIVSSVSRLEPVTSDLRSATGHVLADSVTSGHPVPSFDNSAMDGYAVRFADLASLPVTLPVVAVSAAGTPASRAIAPGEAARILTGGVMVEGADTVVPVEQTREIKSAESGAETWVEFIGGGPRGAHVRRAGEDFAKGETVLAPGAVLGASEVGLAASCGLSHLAVIPRPRVAVVSTGGELVEPGEGDLGPGQIYDSNKATIAAALDTRCGISPVTTAHAGDDADACVGLIRDLSTSHDLILTTGGVSMGGEYDVVKAALRGLEGGTTVDFWQIAIKPAKPIGFGRVGGALFVGLPGNPVSALVSFHLFVRPLVRRLAGHEPAVPAWSRGELGEAIRRKSDGKTHFVRVARASDGRFRKAGGQGSHQLHAMAAADALAVLPDGPDDFGPGSVVDIVKL